MLLGLALDAWSGADVKLPVARVQLAERLGYDSVWTAEAYGADALTPLAYLAASTGRIKLATGVVQISARTPAATAMAFATLEALAGPGRVIAGSRPVGPADRRGVVRPAVGETDRAARDYVAIMRKIFRREAPVAHEGRAITLPYAGPDATGPGQAAAFDPASQPDAADLPRGRRSRERRARGRGRRRLDPDGPLPRQRVRVPPHAGEGRGALGAARSTRSRSTRRRRCA